MSDRDGGGSRGRLVPAFMLEDDPVWNPALHATYCPQHYPPPADGGGSSWLCCCAGPLVELRAAAQALIDAEYETNAWAEAWDVLVDVVAEQERVESEAEAAKTPDNRSDFARFYDAVDEAQRIDNTGGDSAVSVVLWSWGEQRDRELVARSASAPVSGAEKDTA